MYFMKKKQKSLTYVRSGSMEDVEFCKKYRDVYAKITNAPKWDQLTTQTKSNEIKAWREMKLELFRGPEPEIEELIKIIEEHPPEYAAKAIAIRLTGSMIYELVRLESSIKNSSKVTERYRTKCLNKIQKIKSKSLLSKLFDLDNLFQPTTWKQIISISKGMSFSELSSALQSMLQREQHMNSKTK